MELDANSINCKKNTPKQQKQHIGNGYCARNNKLTKKMNPKKRNDCEKKRVNRYQRKGGKEGRKGGGLSIPARVQGLKCC